MPITINGSGSITGANTFTSNASFSGTLGVVGALTQSSGAAFNLASGQLAFPAAQNASSNANTLDDYEEGTWTPTITGSSSNPSYSTSQTYGYYVKIGRLVYVNFLIIVSAVSSQGSGNIIIAGFPFSVGTTSYMNHLLISYNDVWDTAFPNIHMAGNSGYIAPTGVTQSNATWGATAAGQSNLSTGYFSASGCYYANA